jgi:short-subunit dehydrogenase
VKTVLITGASTGIGATYAERFAARGHALVLVARNRERLEALAARLPSAEVLVADLTRPEERARVEARLREDASIELLVNNAGTALPGGFAEQSPDALDQLIQLNVTTMARLSAAVIPRFLAQGRGAIVNVSSVVALVPEFPLGGYGATKAFMLAYSQAMQAELGPRGIYVQAVLPAATRTEIWEHGGRDVDAIEGLMEVGVMVDAALIGFDRRELVTIPTLPDPSQWRAFNAARMAMLANFANAQPAARYRA